MYESRMISIHNIYETSKTKVKFRNTYTSHKITTSELAAKYYNEMKYKITQRKKQQLAKSFPAKSKTLKQRDTAAKKSIVTIKTNSLVTVKLTGISETDSQLRKI